MVMTRSGNSWFEGRRTRRMKMRKRVKGWREEGREAE
jgi:hypothetical protein